METTIQDNTDDNEKNVLIQLKYFFNRSCAIHFVLNTGKWRNAIIRKIDEKEKKVSIKEFVLGNIEYYLSEIDANSIQEYNLRSRRME
jgi:hypothetical protein